ncbi:hypothetical protein [Pseudomonas zhanjiangensis]|uniref:SNARE associated Golgi protein n=1 Tax=Pseudomonas zhanjiangensis TaxID=3239015 RepID=A0ABV3YRF2_9PSED
MAQSRHTARLPLRWARYLKVALFVAVVVGLNVAGSWLMRQIDFQLFPRHEPFMHAMVLGVALLYVLLMATPFMPGIEVGLTLMFLLGSKGALLIYLCTLAALSLSFAVGRALPPRLLWLMLDWLHLYRAGDLIRQLEPLDSKARLKLLNDKIPTAVAPFLLEHRYLTIALLLNLPGNALIGGGGGIGLIVGMSRLVPFPGYLALVACAVAPVPLWFWWRGA